MTLPDDRPAVTRAPEITDAYVQEMIEAAANETGFRMASDRFRFVPAVLRADRARVAAAQARSEQEGEFQPTAAEIAREQDAYCKGYAAAKALCLDPATTKTEERVKALEGENGRLREVLCDIESEAEICPCCDQWLTVQERPFQHHAPDCTLVRALASETGGRDG